MKVIDVTLSRFIRGPAPKVFDVWFDPESPGGPWHGAKKVLMELAVDGMFYFGVSEPVAHEHLDGIAAIPRLTGMLGHYGRFLVVERPRRVEHTWMSEYTHGLETIVSVGFEPREGGTEMTIVHRGLPDDAMGRRHERGWTWLMNRVDQHFGGRS